MSLVSDAKTKVAKLLLNMQRFDQIVNGNETTDVSVDVGTVPTVRKLFDYIVKNVAGIAIKGTVNTVSELPTTGNTNGDIYIVATAGANNAAGDGYIWQATNSAWKNIGPLRGPVGPTGPQGVPGKDGSGGGANGKTVLDYNAKGDGSTDDTAAFNAQLAAEGIIRIPGGKTFAINGRVGSLTNNAKQQIYGQGHSVTTVLLGPNGGFDVSGEGWRIEGIHFVSNGIVECAIKTGENSDSTGSALRFNRFSGAGTVSNYFKICFDAYNTWYTSVVDNVFKNCIQENNYLGIGIRCNYSVNWGVSGNSFYGFNIGYQWSNVAAPNGGFYCEGHMLTANQFVVNRFHMRFEIGLAPMVVNNMLDLVKADGAAIVSNCNVGYFGFNWIAFLGQATNGNACVVLGGESNTFANNAVTAGAGGGGIGLALVNCTYSNISENKFRGMYIGISGGSGCVDITIDNNKFLNQSGPNADVSNLNNNLTWYANSRVGGSGFNLPASYQGAGGSSTPAGKAEFANTGVFTTGPSSNQQAFDFPIPAGIFSQKPICVATIASNPGGPYSIYTDYDNSTTTSCRVVINRSDNAAIGAGGAFRINLIAREPG